MFRIGSIRILKHDIPAPSQIENVLKKERKKGKGSMWEEIKEKKKKLGGILV